jgi:hypothetical protein
MNPPLIHQEGQDLHQQAPQVEGHHSEEDHLDPHPQDQHPRRQDHPKAEKSSQWDNYQRSSLEIGPCPKNSSTN